MSELDRAEQEKVPTKTDDRLRKRIREALSYAAAVAALAGIVLGTLEYQQRKEQWRARQTMDQIDYWDDHGARQAYRSLAGHVGNIVAQVPPNEIAAARTSEELAEKLRARVVELVLRNDGAEESFNDVVYFFSRLSLCIEAEVCNDESAQVFFKDTIDSFLDTFRGEIERRAVFTTGFGAAVVSLADRFEQD